MELEQTIMRIIVHAGQAKSLAMTSIELARGNKIAESDEQLQRCSESMKEAHKAHSELLAFFASEETQQVVPLLLVHAEDHLMAATTSFDFAKEFRLLYQAIYR